MAIIGRGNEVVLTNVRSYLRPKSLEEAWALLRQHGTAARPIGGGVDAALFLPPQVTTLIDLSRLPLRTISETDGRWRIGAAATLTELLEHDLASSYLDGIVGEVLHRVASPLLRNLATVGGTLASAHPWSDVIPLFLVLGAEVTVYDGTLRAVPFDEFLARRADVAGALIVEVRLPAAAAGGHAAFEKFTRTGFDVGMLNCGCLLTIADGACGTVRIAFGGTPQMAARVPALEQRLAGARLDEATIEDAATLAAAVVDVRDDQRASGDYRKILVSVGLRRCLRRVAERAGGGR
jgi:CO/xanthine dehydrogenase FAD-binding subunit